MARIAVDIKVAEYYAPELRDRDHISFVVTEATLVFEDAVQAAIYATSRLGLSVERAYTVISRKCEFQTDTADNDFPDNPRRFRTYRFRYAD